MSHPATGIIPVSSADVEPVPGHATCGNCPAPLTKHFGAWTHHWIYFRDACTNPAPVLNTPATGPVTR